MGSQSISRRDFLRVAGFSSAALLFGRNLDAFGGRRASLLSPAAAMSASTLRAQMEPFVPDAEISITAAEKYVQILSGAQTRVWSYEGQLLGGTGATV